MKQDSINQIISFIRDWYKNEGEDFIPLHRPLFSNLDKELVTDCIDSTFVSSVGKYVDKFEEMICEFTGSKFAVASSSGTTALQLSILSTQAEVSFRQEELILCPSLTFIGTVNPILHSGHIPYFLDAEDKTLGLCPDDLKRFLENETEKKEGRCFHPSTGKFVNSCILVHIFGNPARIKEIKALCDTFNINLIEDAAESLGSFVENKHTGTFGKASALSFNGNKTITTGGGGVLLTDDQEVARIAKHLSTTAKQPHKYEFIHDRTGFNFRLPNLNASLGCAQLKHLPLILKDKKELRSEYESFFSNPELEAKLIFPSKNTTANNWLNAVTVKDKNHRDIFLEVTNSAGIQTRPLWRPMHTLPHLSQFPKSEMVNTNNFFERTINIPSSARKGII